MYRLHRIIAILLAVLFLLPEAHTAHSAAPPVQSDTDPEVEAILRQMDAGERIGQLFIVTFYGSEITPQSEIVQLITDYDIGGVVILPENDNFSDLESTTAQLHTLTTNLQLAASGVFIDENGERVQEITGEGPYVPLLIGIDDQGSGWPVTFLDGASPVPSAMALGATWQPELTRQSGEVAGAEMALLGINLVFGPTADVVETPQPYTQGDQGVLSFGGEAYWVSEHTAAYVNGVHTGSDGRVLVVPRHFPGYGEADRLATVEVPTVRRTLDQLIQFDLQPFFAVTDTTAAPETVADGLLTGHIRYLGFQGDNPRQPTRPISLDSLALQVLMELEFMADWRTSGGLLVTDALGVRGVRRFYDPREITLLNRRIAQDALLAGNDILNLGNFGTNLPGDQTQTVVDTIDFFVQIYEEDPAFQQRVDESVRRILRKKLDLYDEFTLENVLPPGLGYEQVGKNTEIAFEVAQHSVTLLSPDQPDQVTSPVPGDNIVIFTDTRPYTQCSTCIERTEIGVDALQSAILRLYGPEASGLISFADVSSFSLQQLADFLEFGPQPVNVEGAATPEPDALNLALDTADWVIFVMLDANPDAASASVVKDFLAEPPVSADTQIGALAMGAPYYLDSTEISKLTVYYALYDNTPPFVDVAARALFQQAQLSGAAPVSVNGIRYHILAATQPDPLQIITLQYDLVSVEAEDANGTATPEADPIVQLEDTLRITSGIVVDQNGYIVPDGTPVDLILNYVNEGLRSTISLYTVDGVVSTNFVLDRAGALEISANSPPALTSDTIQLSIPDSGSATISVLSPEIAPTATIPSIASTPSEQPGEVEITPTPVVITDPRPIHSVEFGDLFLSLLGLVVFAGGYFTYVLVRRDLNMALLLATPVLLVGLVFYNYYALLLPGAVYARITFGEVWAAPVVTWGGGLLGVALVNVTIYLWERRRLAIPRSRNNR